MIDRHRPRTRRLALFASLFCVLAFLAAACGDDAGDPPPTATITSVPATATPAGPTATSTPDLAVLLKDGGIVIIEAAYARLLEDADMVLMLSSMLHAIGVGNMTPAGVRRICVDISPAVVTKLIDRGSVESTGIVTDVGLFLNLLAARLAADAGGR